MKQIGRPKLKNPRVYVLGVRLTARELSDVVRMSRQAGITASEFARDALKQMIKLTIVSLLLAASGCVGPIEAPPPSVDGGAKAVSYCETGCATMYPYPCPHAAPDCVW